MEDGASHSTALGSITSLGGGDVCLDLSWENGLKLLNQLTTKLLQIFYYRKIYMLREIIREECLVSNVCACAAPQVYPSNLETTVILVPVVQSYITELWDSLESLQRSVRSTELCCVPSVRLEARNGTEGQTTDVNTACS